MPKQKQKRNDRGKAAARVQGVGILPTSLNPGKNESARDKRQGQMKAPSALMKIQQRFARLTAKVKQLDCLKEAVEFVFGFQGKPDQVESIWSAVILARPRPSLETIVTIRPWGIMLLILPLSTTAFCCVI